MESVYLDHIGEIKYYDEDEIIAIIYKHNIVVDEKILRKVIKSSIELASSEKFGLLLDIRAILYVTKEARELSVELEKERIKALAVVLKDGIHSEIFNIFQHFQNPPYPIKAFNKYDKAYQWLKEHN